MALDVFNPVQRPVRLSLGFGENIGALFLCAFEVFLNVIHQNQYAVDYPRDYRPLASRFTVFAMPRGSFVIGTRGRHHNYAVAGLHLAVREAAVSSEHTSHFLKAERFG